MTLSIAQEFCYALIKHRADEDAFVPLLKKFEELKEVLQSNFKITTKEGPWYWTKKNVTRPVILIDIDDKITHSSGKYLFIRINGSSYVMGLGEIGELKDRLFFIEGKKFIDGHFSKDKQVVYTYAHMFGTCDYCLEDKITNVQLFSDVIKKYKQYLVTE